MLFNARAAIERYQALQAAAGQPVQVNNPSESGSLITK
jgi:hypothetical protein